MLANRWRTCAESACARPSSRRTRVRNANIGGIGLSNLTVVSHSPSKLVHSTCQDQCEQASGSQIINSHNEKPFTSMYVNIQLMPEENIGKFFVSAIHAFMIWWIITTLHYL